MASSANLWFRAIAMAMIALLAVPQAFVAAFSPGPRSGSPGWAPAANCVLVILFAALFALSFWRITGLEPNQRAPRWVHPLIVLQTLAAFSLTVDLLPVVAAELGYMLPARQAWRWCAALLLILAAVCVQLAAAGEFVPASGMEVLPFLAQALATSLQMAGWTLFAFVVGRLLAIESEARHAFAERSRMQERLRIARELHDTLGHHLTGLAVTLDLAARVDGEPAKAAIARGHLLSRLLLNDVRDAVAALREDASAGFEPALRALIGRLPDLAVELKLERGVPIGAESAHVFLRCAQEALTNTLRHARASRVWIELRRQDAHWEFTVRDNGAEDGEIELGNGLRGMRERLENQGGSLEITRAGGFLIRARLPREAKA
jgi:signal transduction histidine kinase